MGRNWTLAPLLQMLIQSALNFSLTMLTWVPDNDVLMWLSQQYCFGIFQNKQFILTIWLRDSDSACGLSRLIILLRLALTTLCLAGRFEVYFDYVFGRGFLQPYLCRPWTLGSQGTEVRLRGKWDWNIFCCWLFSFNCLLSLNTFWWFQGYISPGFLISQAEGL